MMERFGKERQELEEQRDRLIEDTSEESNIRDAYDLFLTSPDAIPISKL